ncbi:hypothetical protein AT05_03805 [Schleiferia thermophila str. Yellowstone]|nr:hypothetical protein AT05_03805 [Schleiferia thermophila str. Yellowstone]
MGKDKIVKRHLRLREIYRGKGMRKVHRVRGNRLNFSGDSDLSRLLNYKQAFFCNVFFAPVTDSPGGVDHGD